MIEQIQHYSIMIGITIGAVLIYLWYAARNANRLNLDLIQLNEKLHFDTPAFLRAAWPLLSRADVIGFFWQLDWFGVAIKDEHGVLQGKSLTKEIHIGEMTLRMILHLKPARGERRYFNESLIETFFLLLRTDMLIKSDTTATTFNRMAKLNLFLQHDMKNIAQFIQLMSDQISSVPNGKELQVLDYLRNATPLIRQRADYIVRTLTFGSPKISAVECVQIQTLLSQQCQLYQLDYEIHGACEVVVPVNIFDSALDNILKNYSDLVRQDKQLKPRLHIDIRNLDEIIEINIEAVNLPCPPNMERLFEPFWSSDPDGLGIGLYQAKQMLELCHGRLGAQKTELGRLRFTIQLPVR